MKTEHSSSRIFYGWWLVLVCLVIQGISTGVSIYSYSIFAGEVEAAFSSSRTLVMLGMTGQSVMIALASPIVGTILDRVSIKWTIISAALIMGLGFCVISIAPSIWGFISSYVLLVALGLAALGMLSSSVLLSRWFQRYRGLAIGIAALGTQLGGLAIPPLIAFLIDTFDWRFAALAVGLGLVVVLPLLAYLTIVDRPSDKGLSPDGGRMPLDSPPIEDKAPGNDSLWVWQLLSDRNFWFVGMGIAAMIAVFTTVLANLSLFATDIGTPREQAALLISLFAAVGLVSSPIVGRLCDVIDTRWVFAGMLLLSIAAMIGYLVARTYTGLAVATAIIAISGAGLTSVWSALIGDLFDIQLYARVMGAMALFTGAVGSLAPVASGWLYDSTGSYRALFFALIVFLLPTLLCVPLIKRRRAIPANNAGGMQL